MVTVALSNVISLSKDVGFPCKKVPCSKLHWSSSQAGTRTTNDEARRFNPRRLNESLHEVEVDRKHDTYGPLCSRASQVKTYLRILKPHPRNRARCESASPPSDKSPSGRPTKLWPSPASTLSQNPSRTCEGWLRGFLDDPDRFTPRRMSTRPWLSTKWFAVVWT